MALKVEVAVREFVFDGHTLPDRIAACPSSAYVKCTCPVNRRLRQLKSSVRSSLMGNALHVSIARSGTRVECANQEKREASSIASRLAKAVKARGR